MSERDKILHELFEGDNSYSVTHNEKLFNLKYFYYLHPFVLFVNLFAVYRWVQTGSTFRWKMVVLHIHTPQNCMDAGNMQEP